MITLNWTESVTKASQIDRYQLWRSTSLDPDAADFLRTFSMVEEFVVERDTFGAISNSEELYSWVDEEAVGTPEAPLHFYILAIPVQGPSARSNVLSFDTGEEPEPGPEPAVLLGDFEYFRGLVGEGQSSLHGAHTLQAGTDRLVIVPFVSYPIAVDGNHDIEFDYGGITMTLVSAEVDLAGIGDVEIGFAYVLEAELAALTPGEYDITVTRGGGPSPNEFLVTLWIGSFESVPQVAPEFLPNGGGGDLEMPAGSLLLNITGSQYATSPPPFHLTFLSSELPDFDPDTSGEWTTYGELTEPLDTEGLAWAVGLAAGQATTWTAAEGHNGLTAGVVFAE